MRTSIVACCIADRWGHGPCHGQVFDSYGDLPKCMQCNASNTPLGLLDIPPVKRGARSHYDILVGEKASRQNGLSNISRPYKKGNENVRS